MSSFLDLCCYSSFFPEQKRNSLLVEWTVCLIIQRILESAACLSEWQFSPGWGHAQLLKVLRRIKNEIFQNNKVIQCFSECICSFFWCKITEQVGNYSPHHQVKIPRCSNQKSLFRKAFSESLFGQT